MSDSQRMRILLVEDHVVTGEMYRNILQEYGFDVDYAINGAEAYALAYRGGYSLILMDVKMPKMSGLEVLQKLRETSTEQKNGPIVMLTNLNDEELTQRAMGLGALSYMDKSNLEPKQLVSKVCGVLGLPYKPE